MEVNLSPELEGKLVQAAGRRGVSADVLIREAIERAVDYDDWFIREVEKGLAQVDAGLDPTRMKMKRRNRVGATVRRARQNQPQARRARRGTPPASAHASVAE